MTSPKILHGDLIINRGKGMRRLDYLKEGKVRDLVKGSLHPHKDCGLVTLATNQISGYDRA